MNILRARLPFHFPMVDEPGAAGGGTPPAATPAPTPAPPPPEDDPDAAGRALAQPDARLEAMRRISAANLERMEEEHAERGLTIGGDDDGQGAPPADTPPPAPPAAPRARKAAPPPAPAPEGTDQITLQLGQPVDIEALDNLTVRVKIDGQMVERPFKEVRRDIQIDGAAQSRLEVATRLLDTANEMAKRAAPATAPAPGAPAAPPVGSDEKAKPDDSAAVADLATRLTQSLFDGDEGKTKALLTEALQTLRSNGAGIDESGMATRVAGTVRQQLSNEEAEAKFIADFNDVVADPYLAAVADAELARVQKEKPKLSYEAQLAEAGNATRAWMSARGMKPATEPAAPAPPAPPANREKRLTERKAAIDNVTGTSSRAQAPAVPEPPSTSSVIDKMRQGRAVQGARA